MEGACQRCTATKSVCVCVCACLMCALIMSSLLMRMTLVSCEYPRLARRVRGFVVDMSKAGPRHFDFDATVSRTEMADRLWALMDE